MTFSAAYAPPNFRALPAKKCPLSIKPNLLLMNSNSYPVVWFSLLTRWNRHKAKKLLLLKSTFFQD